MEVFLFLKDMNSVCQGGMIFSMTKTAPSNYDRLMNAKARALANKFLINILIVLLVVNGGLGFMLTLNIRSDAKLWLAALLIFIDVTVLVFAAIRDRKIKRYFKLPHRKAKVVVSGHSNFMFGGRWPGRRL